MWIWKSEIQEEMEYGLTGNEEIKAQIKYLFSQKRNFQDKMFESVKQRIFHCWLLLP